MSEWDQSNNTSRPLSRMPMPKGYEVADDADDYAHSCLFNELERLNKELNLVDQQSQLLKGKIKSIKIKLGLINQKDEKWVQM